MKRKLFIISLMIVMVACLFAINVSARTDYREEQTYNYYDTEGNLLYSATTIYANDSKNAGKYRFEVIINESGEGFAKFDENGTPLTWYVTSDDKLDDIIGGSSLDQDGVQNITVKSIPTLDESIATVTNGQYNYKTDTYGVSFAKKVVSANFFTTGVKSFPNSTFKSIVTVQPNGNASEYCKMTDGGYLLCLYLPETLTAVPSELCKYAPLTTLEFENNKISGTSIDASAFNYCANLERLVVPEGITEIKTETFRECLRLTYVKLANSVLTMGNNAFSRCSNIETFIMGEKMTFCGYLSGESQRFYVEDTRPAEGAHIKYYYVSKYINTKCDFDSYRGAGQNVQFYGPYRNIIFMFPGTLAEAAVVAQYTGESFKATLYPESASSKKMTYNEAIDYETYIANKEYYDTQITHHLLVYNVPECIAFYEGHDMEERNTFTDVLTPFVVGNICTRCEYAENNATKYDAVIEFLGYSAQLDGNLICSGYKTNKESLAACPDISYGILATIPTGDEATNCEPLNPDLTANVSSKVVTVPVDKKYSQFNFIIKGFDKNSEHYGTDLVMGLYVTDGTKVDYLSLDKSSNTLVQNEYAGLISFQYIATELVPKFEVTFGCNTDMGTLTGETTQFVKEGEKSVAVTATAKEGYQFASWSDGTTDATIEYSPEKATELTAYFTPKSTGLPVITINTEGQAPINSLENYVNCEITLLDTEKGKSIGGQTAEIKGRGNSTWTKFDKKPYKVKFEDKQNLFGYGKEKTWVLLADARDYSLVRNMLALNAGLSMSELEYTSKGQSVELYLNGEYRGVYYLCEQIQVKDNRVNITQEDDGKDLDNDGRVDPDSIGYLIEMDAWAADGSNQSGIANYTKDGDVFVTINGGQKPFVIKDPEDVFFDEDGNFSAENAAPYLAYVKEFLQQCHDAMYAEKTSENYAKLCELIDVKSFAQTYIIFDLFKNPDVNYSSVYYYKDAGGKLVSAPIWDFDMAIGNVTHKEGNTGWQIFSDTTRLWTKERNYWFNQLLQYKEFAELVGQELKENADNLRASIAADLAYARAHADAYKKNFEKWNLIGNTSASEAMGAWSVPADFKAFETWEEHLDYIANYLEESLTYLISVYPAPAAE